MLLIKNPQFLPNFDDTLSKWPIHELVNLAKCHKNWIKIVDFLLIAYFWARCQFRWYILYLHRGQTGIQWVDDRYYRNKRNNSEAKTFVLFFTPPSISVKHPYPAPKLQFKLCYIHIWIFKNDVSEIWIYFARVRRNKHEKP